MENRKEALKTQIIKNRDAIVRLIENSKTLDYVYYQIRTFCDRNEALITEIAEIEKAEKLEEERNRNRPPATPFKIGGFRESNPDQKDDGEQIITKWKKN